MPSRHREARMARGGGIPLAAPRQHQVARARGQGQGDLRDSRRRIVLPHPLASQPAARRSRQEPGSGRRPDPVRDKERHVRPSRYRPRVRAQAHRRRSGAVVFRVAAEAGPPARRGQHREHRRHSAQQRHRPHGRMARRGARRRADHVVEGDGPGGRPRRRIVGARRRTIRGSGRGHARRRRRQERGGPGRTRTQARSRPERSPRGPSRASPSPGARASRTSFPRPRGWSAPLGRPRRPTSTRRGT